MKHASLFSGIGGFDLAASWMGWENVFQVEKDEYCRQILAKHFPDVERYHDIRDFIGTKYYGTIDIISGGFPCQPFSQAGKQKGKKDDRYLWPEMLRIIEKIKPTWVVGENVPGIITMALDEVLSSLEHKGYSCQTFVIPACAINAIHRRDRVWIIAHSDLARKMREPSKCKSACREEQIQEWNKICLTCKSDEISSIHVTDSENLGCRGRTSKGCTGIKRREFLSRECERREVGCKIEGCCGIGTSTDSNIRWDRRYEREGIKKKAIACGSESQSRIRLRYPISKPTICRGDDGLSYRLDDGSLISSRQRRNSLHALGNAIVPQVAFEIFRIIEKLNKEMKNNLSSLLENGRGE